MAIAHLLFGYICSVGFEDFRLVPYRKEGLLIMPDICSTAFQIVSFVGCRHSRRC